MESWIKDIKTRKFSKALRGYDILEVEAYLELVGERVENLQEDNNELSLKLDDYNTNMQELENDKKQFNDLQLSTQKDLKRLKENAEREAKLIIADAKVKAETIKEKAFREKKLLEQEVEELKVFKKSFLTRFKHLLEQQFETLKLYSKD